jgi:hypothetical protein
MNSDSLYMLIPIVAILTTFGFPVALVFVWKWFKLKERELQLDADFRKTSGQALEQRVQRLESIILALDADLRAKLTAAPPAQLMEGPATQESGQAGPDSALPARVR